MMLTQQDFLEQVMDGVFDDIYLYHNGPYNIGDNKVEFLQYHMKCSGPSITATYFTYDKENVLPAMLYLDYLSDKKEDDSLCVDQIQY